MTKDNQDALRSLYEVTGNVTDANTVLISRSHLRRLVRENESLTNQVLHLQAELNRLNGVKQVPAILKKKPCDNFGRCNCSRDCQIG